MKIRLTESKFKNMLSEMVREVLTEAKMSLEDVYNKYYSDIDKNIFLAAVNADPTSKRTEDGNIIGIGVYTKWILNLVKQGKWKPGDTPETTYSLTTYHKLKQQLPLDKRDINLFKSVPELYNFVEELSPTKSRSEVKQDVEKVYEDEQWKIIIPHTKEAACLYGKNTKWCTAATQSDNSFDYYNNQGPLYINIDHVNNQKYQFHFETNSFMNENDESVDPGYIGLSEGAINYYKSIGKAKYFLTIKDIQTYAQQGDFSIFDSVEETNIGLKLCYFNLKRQVYLIKPNGEIIGDTGFKEIYPRDNVFEVQNKNNYLYSFVIPVGNDYKLITNEQGEELWFRDIFKIITYGNCFKVQNNEGLYSILIPVDNGREGKYKPITNEQGEELWFDYMIGTDSKGIKVTKYNDEHNKEFQSLLIPVGNDYKLITDEYGEELWFDKIKSYYNDFIVTYNDNTMWGYLIPVSDGRDGKYKIVSKEEFRQYERQRTSLNEMINRLVRNYLKY